MDDLAESFIDFVCLDWQRAAIMFAAVFFCLAWLWRGLVIWRLERRLAAVEVDPEVAWMREYTYAVRRFMSTWGNLSDDDASEVLKSFVKGLERPPEPVEVGVLREYHRGFTAALAITSPIRSGVTYDAAVLERFNIGVGVLIGKDRAAKLRPGTGEALPTKAMQPEA